MVGFRTFDGWRRERVEERRIDIALEVLAYAYEAAAVFDEIRSPMSFEWEWSEMEGVEDPQKRLAAGPYFAVLKRMERHRDYFERGWRLQPKYMAAFGRDSGKVFDNLHKARTNVQVSAEMLMRGVLDGDVLEDVAFQQKLRNEVWRLKRENDEISPLVDAFVVGVEKSCLPVVARKFV